MDKEREKEEREKEKEKERGRVGKAQVKMHFDQVSRSPPFKVWSGHLPKQFGGVEATWVDQSTTKLGRGVQFLSSPTSSKIPRNNSVTTIALPTTD